MTKRAFAVEVTRSYIVEFDTDKLDDEFWAEFNSTITDRGGEDLPYLAEHAVWNFMQGDTEFIEGIGDLKEAGVVISEDQSDVYFDCTEQEPGHD